MAEHGPFNQESFDEAAERARLVPVDPPGIPNQEMQLKFYQYLENERVHDYTVPVIVRGEPRKLFASWYSDGIQYTPVMHTSQRQYYRKPIDDDFSKDDLLASAVVNIQNQTVVSASITKNGEHIDQYADEEEHLFVFFQNFNKDDEGVDSLVSAFKIQGRTLYLGYTQGTLIRVILTLPDSEFEFELEGSEKDDADNFSARADENTVASRRKNGKYHVTRITKGVLEDTIIIPGTINVSAIFEELFPKEYVKDIFEAEPDEDYRWKNVTHKTFGVDWDRLHVTQLK